MADKLSPEQRSWNMSRIKSKNTSLEVLVRKWLFSFGYRFRINDSRYPGSPDIVLPKYKTAIFVNGCFWHGHSCKLGHLPKSRTRYWNDKIAKTQKRDEQKIRELRDTGWNVIVLWECELKPEPGTRLISLLSEINGTDYSYV